MSDSIPSSSSSSHDGTTASPPSSFRSQHLAPLPETTTTTTTTYVTSLEPLPETKTFEPNDDGIPPPPPPPPLSAEMMGVDSPLLMGSPKVGSCSTTPLRGHRKNTSSLSDISLIEIVSGKDGEAPELHVHHGSDVLLEGLGGGGGGGNSSSSSNAMIIPKSTLLVVTETAHLEPSMMNHDGVFGTTTMVDGVAVTNPDPNVDGGGGQDATNLVNTSFTISGTTQLLQDMVHDITDFDFDNLDGYKFQVKDWDGKKHYSDYIAQGLRYKRKEADKKKAEMEAAAAYGDSTNHSMDVTSNSANTTTISKTMTNAANIYSDNIVMLFDSPTSSTAEFAFHNASKFRFHDWPPPSKTGGKSVLGPCRYALMSGDTFPVFLKDGALPCGLLEHWTEAVPGFTVPTFVDKITDEHTVYAYLPVEQIRHHVNDPDVHYHLAGKDAIHLMTQKVCIFMYMYFSRRWFFHAVVFNFL
jgi:hypothetical protein